MLWRWLTQIRPMLEPMGRSFPGFSFDSSPSLHNLDNGCWAFPDGVSVAMPTVQSPLPSWPRDPAWTLHRLCSDSEQTLLTLLFAGTLSVVITMTQPWHCWGDDSQGARGTLSAIVDVVWKVGSLACLSRASQLVAEQEAMAAPSPVAAFWPAYRVQSRGPWGDLAHLGHLGDFVAAPYIQRRTLGASPSWCQ